MTKTWQLQDAKNRLSEVVQNALSHGHQTITLRGEPAVVVMSIKQFNMLQTPRTPLTEFFKSSPLRGVNLDLKRAKDLPREASL